jgi:elongator complex protein 3
MPGLPGSDEKRDIEVFQTIFENPQFKPDMLKIYPTIAIKGTKLYDLWKKGDYEPLSTEKASMLLAKIKSIIPEWIRIQRIQRDVPSNDIEAGADKSNLRQYVTDEMIKQKLKCRCIRCREIGHKSLKEKIESNEDEIGLSSSYYDASGGEEVFMSLVEKDLDALIGYLRLRDIRNSHRPEINKNPCMLIRELKVVGRELQIGERENKALQHKGYGKELLEEAERICVEKYDKSNLFVLSGVGVKKYYRNLGFTDDGVYLRKALI